MSTQTSHVGPYEGTGDYRKFFYDLNNKSTTKEIDISRIPLEGTNEAWRVVDISSHNGTLGDNPSQIVIVQIPMVSTTGELGFYKPTTAVNWTIGGISGQDTWMLAMYLNNEGGGGERGTTTLLIDDSNSGVVYDMDMYVYYNSSQALDTGIISVTLERMEIPTNGKIVALFEQARRTRQRNI